MAIRCFFCGLSSTELGLFYRDVCQFDGEFICRDRDACSGRLDRLRTADIAGAGTEPDGDG